MHNIFGFILALPLLTGSAMAVAQSAEDLAAMQKQLNQQVLEKPFSVEDEKKIDAYIQDAMKKDLQPEVKNAPDYWQPGYTCANIYSYGWRAYRNCRYYLRYHGSYWY